MPTAEALSGIPVATDPLTPPLGMRENPSNPGEEPPGTCPAATMCNLLPAAGNPGTSAPSIGVYIGEGLPPVPLKLAEKIRRWEYIDMSELLPEFWVPLGSSQQEGDPPDQPRTPARRRRKVTDIATWVQCFATYVGVLAGMSPEAIPELMAYLVHIVRVSQDFGGLAWVNYDSAFRRQAASTGNRQWSRVNPSLYSICFSGVARTSKRCDLCLSLTHEVKDCALANEGDHDVGSRLKAIESAVLALTSATPSTSTGPPNRSSRTEICRSWNENRCSFPRCRYRHVCRVCEGPRPALECCERPLGPVRPPVVSPISRSPFGRPRDATKPY